MSDDNNSFSFSYSGAINEELEQIKEKYTPKDVNKKTKKIHALDKKVDFTATMISIFLGIFGSAFAICGTIWIIKDIYSGFISITTTLSGVIISAMVPFIHTKIHSLIKSHYAERILALIKEVEQNGL